MKLCTKCNTMKDDSDFYTRNGKPYLPCKQCKADYQRERMNDDSFRAAMYSGIAKYKRTTKGKQTRRREYDKRVEAYRPIKEANDAARNAARKAKTDARDKVAMDRIDAQQRQAEYYRTSPTFMCRTCNNELPRDNFYMYKNGSPRSSCKTCHARMMMNSTLERHRHEIGIVRPDDYHGRKDPRKQLARMAVSWAIICGDLIRPTICPVCNSTKRIQAHHEDYTRPLDVIWLCEQCHKDLHFKGDTKAKSTCHTKID